MFQTFLAPMSQVFPAEEDVNKHVEDNCKFKLSFRLYWVCRLNHMKPFVMSQYTQIHFCLISHSLHVTLVGLLCHKVESFKMTLQDITFITFLHECNVMKMQVKCGLIFIFIHFLPLSFVRGRG